MNTSSKSARQSITLAKLATILAIIFGIAFGLCAVSATIVMGANEKAGGFLVWAAVIVEALCAIALLVIAALAIIQSASRKE